jgi:cytoskeletal protein RodZ
MILRKLKENGGLWSDMSNFGASLKKARESKGISLDRISAETRISTRFLLAIENEEFNLLPGGIFNRGFVRAYAEKVGLDPNQIVAEYERLIAIREPPAATVQAHSTRPNVKGDRHLYPLAIGGLVLLILVFYIFTRETSNTAQSASAPSATSVAAAPQPASSAPPTAPPSEAVTPPSAPPEVTSAAPEPETPPQTEPLRIDIDITEATWIKVKVDGMTVDAGEILQPGTTRHFTAQNSLYLSVGNAGGLSLRINNMPAKAVGKSGQVRELNITPENIATFIG